MPKQDIKTGQPRKGMQRDKAVVDLSETEYSFSLNSNIASDTGDTFFLQNEPSNILCNNFPQGFRVVGREYDINTNRTYYMLTNPDTGVSEIGYILNINDIEDVQDAERECGCDISKILSEPLEEQEPVPTCTYTTLLNDSCNLCLGFSIHHPINKMVIKYEHLGTTIWWTDGSKTLRYLKVDDLEPYSYTGEDNCGEDNTIPTCLDCEKLRVFQEFEQPVLRAESIQQGGKLKAGSYETLIAYSDLTGNEISSYYSVTNAVSIFDPNNTILTQAELEYDTDFGIRIKINNLDRKYPYYKIAIIYTGGINGTTYYQGNVYSTSDSEIIITSLQDFQPVSISKLLVPKKVYDKADGLTASGGILYWYGTSEQEEINFQPCANLLGAFLRWLTVEAKETLYKDGVNVANYKSFMRDEAYPFSIQLLSDNGWTSADFPLIHRPPTAFELETVNNKDTQSILEYTTTCTPEERNKRWQFYNTAVDLGYYQGEGDGNYNVVDREVIKFCITDNIYTASSLEVPIDCTVAYTTFESYVGTYRNQLCDSGSIYYNPELCDILSDQYEDQVCTFDDENCSEPVYVANTAEVNLSSVGSENMEITYNDISDLDATPTPANCNSYRIGANPSGHENDTAFEADYMSIGEEVFKRNNPGTNIDCSTASTLFPTTPINIGSLGTTYLTYAGAYDITDLQTSKESVASGSTFTNFLHTNAQWYKVNFGVRDSVIFELTKIASCDISDDIPIGTDIRYTTYSNCTDTANIASAVVDLSSGTIIALNKADYSSGIAYIAIDSPIQTKIRTSDITYIISPPCGCFAVVLRDFECVSKTVTVTAAVFSRKAQYSLTCQFNVPVNSDCEPTPYKYGKFGYYQSVNTYPDNEELYNSSNLKIDINEIPIDYREEFEDYFMQGNTLVADFRCQPIRHPKFPDFSVSPFMSENPLQIPFSDSFIYPIGVTLDEDLVNYFLDVAVENKLLTQDQRNKIVGYKIKTGDRTLHKSILAKGIGNDMFTYTEEGSTDPQPILFPNFPYNDNHENILLYQNDNRNSYIQHPYAGNYNHNFTFHSPETSFNKPTLPSEIKIEAFQFGHSRGNFVNVEDHVREVVLGQDAYTIATSLAVVEFAFETALKIADQALTAANNQWVFAGPAGAGGSATVIGYGVWASAYGLALSAVGFLEVGKRRKEWLDIIDGLGEPRNFGYYYTSVGKYNYSLPNVIEGETLRALKTGKYLKQGNYKFTEETTGETIKINNRDRESSVFISVGEQYPFTYPSYYKDFDNSRTISSLSTNCENKTISSTVEKQIASPYFSLKNFIVDQYGQIGDIKWISTGYTGDLRSPRQFPQIFGGDVFLTRLTKKIKHPLFKATAMKLADRTPFSYSIEKNVGTPRFYADFYVASNNSYSDLLFPELSSEYNFDCSTGTFSTYVRNPSKFYLFYYGIPSFIVESEINLEYRYAREGLENNFYPNIEDYIDYTQERNVPIRQDNTYFYNNAYSKKTTQVGNRSLPIDYSSAYFKKIAYQPNQVFYSLEDNSDTDKFEPWLAYKPLDFYTFKSDLGKLISLDDIESAQVIGRFENGMLRYNSIDKLRERITPETQELGTGGVFAQRPLEFKRTKLGYMGTQTTQIVSCEFGHFWPDAKRGQVFQIDQNGENGKDITDGCTRWFKEQLPFKILKTGIQGINTDNSFNAAGITMGYDSKNKRVLMTKKDYIPVKDRCIEYNEDLGFVVNETLCDDVPPTISCPEGYTYNTVTQTCDKTIYSNVCTDGFTYNPLTQLCEKEATDCSDGLDLIFILDATASQGGSINGIKNAISSDIVPAIIAEFGVNYRLGLIVVRDQRESGQYLFEILEPMDIANETSFLSAITTVMAGGGANVAEPSDLALAAALNNTPAIDKDGVVVAALTTGVFRTNAAKAIILTTDAPPSGLDDSYQFADWTNANNLAIQAEAAGVQIFPYFTPNNATVNPPVPPDSPNPPNTTYLMQNYANVTNGTYYFKPFGTGIGASVVEAITSGIECSETAEPICGDDCIQDEDICACTLTAEPISTDVLTPISVDDPDYFIEASFTAAYSPLTQSWISYYSYLPNYYVSLQDYFQSGKNNTEDKGVWSHLLTNKSYQVFYGKLYPWIVETPIKASLDNKILTSLNYMVDSERFHNEYDTTSFPKIGFNEVIIYNSTNNSGVIKLTAEEKNNLYQKTKYPITNIGSQEVLVTKYDDIFQMNYFFNRAKSEDNNIPVWIKDNTDINKIIDTSTLTYRSPLPERMKGNWFLVRYYKTEDSNIHSIFRFNIDKESLY